MVLDPCVKRTFYYVRLMHVLRMVNVRCTICCVAVRDYQESVTTGQTDTQIDRRTDGQTDAGQSDPYVSQCFAGDTKSMSL